MTIEVTNEAPYAENDYYEILHDTTLDEPSGGVVWNDSLSCPRSVMDRRLRA